MTAAELLPAVLDPVIGALGAASAPRVQREPGNADHIVVAPEMTRDELVAWLFEGRAQPPQDRLRPDPLTGAASDRQRRFLFRPTPEEVRRLRRDFAQRWIDSGPGWFLEGALPGWVPADVRAQIGELDRAGALRRSLAPVVRTFEGDPPYGQIVMWYGAGDFLSFDELFCYQEFPENLDFYMGLAGIDAWQARLLHQVYTWFNRDMRLFVVDRRMRPDRAREELQRIWGEVFRGVLEGAMAILGSGTAISALNRLPTFASGTVEAALQSIRAKRQLFSLWARQRTPWQVLFRGTTFKRLLEGAQTGVFRDITLNLEHDLGFGTYFTPVRRIAEEFASAARAVGEQTLDNVNVVLRLTVRDRQVLGPTLDLIEGPLAQEWAQAVRLRARFTDAPLLNESYNRMLQQFLASQGTSLEEYATIIAWDYLHNGPQICIKSDEIVRKLLLLADELAP